MATRVWTELHKRRPAKFWAALALTGRNYLFNAAIFAANVDAFICA